MKKTSKFQIKEKLLRIIGPLQPDRTPGKSTAKGSENDIIAFFELIFPFP
jgi:hypothetical protein